MYFKNFLYSQKIIYLYLSLESSWDLRKIPHPKKLGSNTPLELCYILVPQHFDKAIFVVGGICQINKLVSAVTICLWLNTVQHSPSVRGWSMKLEARDNNGRLKIRFSE